MLATVVVASGCTTSEPQPEVVEDELEGEFENAVTGQATMNMIVLNKGDPGEVDVRAEVSNVDGFSDTARKSIYMGAGERREVDLDITVPTDGEPYTHTASARPSE